MIINKSFVLTLSTGMLCGFLSYYLLSSTISLQSHSFDGYSLNFERHPHSHDDLENASGPKIPVLQHSTIDSYQKAGKAVAEKLAKKVKVLCWIMTNPQNHKRKAKHVKATWAKRCNQFVFVSTEKDEELNTVVFNIKEGRNHLWEKTKESFRYVFFHYYNQTDWFLKADDDTYVIVENLRYMLSPYDPSDPIWFGRRFKKYVKQGYMSGGAGYVISKEALRRFVEEALPNPDKCKQDGSGAEDVEMGKCLENVGVKAIDSRDQFGHGRFFPYIPEHHLIPGHIGPKDWFWEWIYYPSTSGMQCCSDTAISFHYVSPNYMYILDYFLYYLRPYGIESSVPFPPPLPPDVKGMPPEVLEKYGKSRLVLKKNENSSTTDTEESSQNYTLNPS